jgi:polyhydroxybutyrate depolymerase
MRPLSELFSIGLLVVVLAVVALTVALSFGGPRTRAAAATFEQGAIEVSGQRRTFSVALPSNYSKRKRYPIVMMLHGGRGSGSLIAKQTRLADYVDRDQFIAVFPDAGGRQWNDGRETTRGTGDDVSFLVALVDHVAKTYGGDAGRAFLAGPSNGGAMTLRVACEAPGAFRAYGAVVAGLPQGATCPSGRAPVIFIMSRDDPRVPWGGGSLAGGAGRGGVGGRVMSAMDTVEVFARANGCSEASIQDLADRVDDGTSVRVHAFKGCGNRVILYELAGAGHAWPGMAMRRGPRATQMFGAVSREINATEVVLDFFSRHGM